MERGGTFGKRDKLKRYVEGMMTQGQAINYSTAAADLEMNVQHVTTKVRQMAEGRLNRRMCQIRSGGITDPMTAKGELDYLTSLLSEKQQAEYRDRISRFCESL